MKSHSLLHPHGPAAETRGRVIRWAHSYDRFVNLLTLGRSKTLRKMTVELARIQPGERVLDVGCGTGDLTLLARERAGAAGAVCGIDASPEMIQEARRKADRAGVEIDFRAGLIESLSFPDQSFEVVLSSLMMHHLPDDLKRRGLAEIGRVLKPGGRLVVVDIERPATFSGRVLMALFMHAGLRSGVQDLPALMAQAGFVGVVTGRLGFGILGFVTGRRDPLSHSAPTAAGS